MKKCLWEILIPTVRNDGKPFKTKYHRVWDEKVRKISGGLTIQNVAKGQWVSPNDELFVERMIPVRILATEDEINEIIKVTMNYYDQEAILVYEISNNVKLVNRSDLED